MDLAMIDDNKQELWNSILSSFSVDVLNGGDVIPESTEYYVCSLLFAYMEEIYSDVRNALKEENIDTACCENLYKIGARRGILRRGRTLPTAIIKITGKCGAVLPDHMEFEFKGVILKTIFTIKSFLDQKPHLDEKGETYVIAQIDDYTRKSVDIPPNSKGELVKEYKDINKEVILVGTICQGQDEETCEEYRQRLIRSHAYALGSKIDITNLYVRDFPCLTDVMFIENPNCCPVYDKNLVIDPACVYVIPIFANNFPIGQVPEVILKMFEAWLFGSPKGYGLGKLPINLCGEAIQLKPQYFRLNVVLRYETLYHSQIQKIKDAVFAYVGSLKNGGFINTAQIQEIINQVAHKPLDACIELLSIEDKTPDGLIFSEDGNTIQAFCDMVLVCESIHFYNSTGTEL